MPSFTVSIPIPLYVDPYLYHAIEYELRLSSVWKYMLPKKRSVMVTSALVMIIPCMN